MSAFLITFRESLEAGVIVGILFSLLAFFQAQKHSIYVWLGVALGIVASALFALLFILIFGAFEGVAEKLYEGILMVFAAGLITHMIFWMRKQGRFIEKALKEKVSLILEKKTLWMLAVIAFLSVVREGVETVIFFFAIDAQMDNAFTYIFAVLGVICAVALSVLIATSSRKMSSKVFFQASGILLIFVAGGLLAHGIVEFQGAGTLPTFIKPVYDLGGILSEKEGVGLFLKSLFGYDANPSLLAIIAYLTFMPLVLYRYLRK